MYDELLVAVVALVRNSWVAHKERTRPSAPVLSMPKTRLLRVRIANELRSEVTKAEPRTDNVESCLSLLPLLQLHCIVVCHRTARHPEA